MKDTSPRGACKTSRVCVAGCCGCGLDLRRRCCWGVCLARCCMMTVQPGWLESTGPMWGWERFLVLVLGTGHAYAAALV